MKKALIIITAIIVLLGGGYYLLKNTLPQLIFKPIDLGVRETSDIIYSYYNEIGFKSELEGEEPKSGELLFEGEINIEKTFTQQELNSCFTSWEDWKGTPLSDIQIKIHEDGTAEAAALITVQKAEEIAKTLGYTDEEITEAKKFLKFVPNSLPLYGKGTATIENNTVNLNVTSLKIANISLPGDIPSQVGNVIADMAEKVVETMAPQTNIELAEITPKGVDVKGTFPKNVKLK